MKLKFLAAIGFAAILYSCDDTTTGIGDFVAENDGIEAFSDSYDISTRTILLDSIFSRTSSAYLGRFTDPEYGTFSAEFLTQINCPEGYEFPSTSAIEEATLVMYYNSYYGDSLATMRVQVDTLNQSSMMTDQTNACITHHLIRLLIMTRTNRHLHRNIMPPIIIQ